MVMTQTMVMNHTHHFINTPYHKHKTLLTTDTPYRVRGDREELVLIALLGS